MAVNIHNAEPGTPDTGAWVQAAAGHPALLRVESTDADAQCAVLVSEVDGPGIGNAARELTIVYGSDAIFLPAGTYYINVNIQRNDGTVDVVAQT